MKAIVLGGGFYNKGAEAMSFTVINELLGRKLCDKILFVCSYGQYDGALKSINSENLDDVVELLMLPNPLNYSENFSLVKKISEYDYAVDISGLQLSDKANEVSPINYWIKTVICKTLDIPYYILPQALGPFSNEKVNIFAKKVFANVDLIFARDEKSFDYIKELSNEFLHKLYLAPDIAFLFEKNLKAKQYSKILRVTIIPNVRAYNRIKIVNGINYYTEAIKKIIEACPINSQITLLPHEYNDNGFDDLDLVNNIVSQLNRNDLNINIIKQTRTAKYLKEIISNSDIVISSRYHAAIAALSCEIPTMTIGWAEKYPELLKLFSLENYSLDIDNISLESTVNKFQDILNNKDKIRYIIREKLNYIIGESEKVFDILEKKICEHFKKEKLSI